MKFLVVLCSVVTHALAPTSLYGQKVFGLRTGLNLTTFDVRPAEGDRDYIAGFHLGAALYLPVSDQLGFTVGSAFTQKGAESSPVTWRVNYLETSALLTYGIPVGGHVAARIFLGPSFALEVGENVSTGGESGFVSTGYDTLDFGVVAGGGVRHQTTESVILSVDLLYNFGLRTLRQTSEKNRALSVQAGVGFPIR